VVVEVFSAGAVGADVVGAPAAAELIAAGGQAALSRKVNRAKLGGLLGSL